MKKSLYLLSTLVLGLLLNYQFASAQVVPEVTVIQPSEAGIEWIIGNTYLISWVDNFTRPVDIYLVDDDFATTGNNHETLIGDDVEGSTYAWEIDGALNPSNFCKIRVESSVNNIYNDDSQEYFKLLANASNSSMVVEQPSLPNIDWVVGQTYLISWVDNMPGTVDIDLMQDDGVTLVSSIATNKEGSTFWWNTTGYAAGSYKVRVTNNGVADVSDNAFNLVVSLPGTIDLLQPTANNTQILVGSTYLISWIDDISENVKIELTDAAGANPHTIVASTSGSTYLWNTGTLPAGNLITNGGTYKIKVTSVNSTSITDISEFAFTAIANTGSEVTVLQPSESGIEWLLGGQYLISWIDDFSDNVNIELWDEFGSTGSKVADIATNVAGSTYIWNTAINPVTLDPGTYTIKIANSDGSISDFSDNTFDIIATSGSIEVLQPNIAGINWVVGSTHLISWIDNVPGPVNIELVGSAPFTIASDKADNYGGTWADGDNEGYGFGPWSITSNITDGVADAFIDDPTVVGNLTNMDDPSFGIVANTPTQDPNNWIAAYRSFSTPLELENTFSFDWGIYGPSGYKDFILYGDGGATELIKFSIDYTTSHTIYVTYNGNSTAVFNNIGTNVMHFTFNYLANGDLRVQANSRDGVEPNFDQTYAIAFAPDAIGFKAAGQFQDGVNDLLRVNWFNNFKIQTYIADIATNVEGTTYLWNTTGFGAGTYKIRVKNGDIEDESDNTFNLVLSAGGTLTFEAPLPGAQWVSGASYWISWNDTYMEPLDVYLRRGAGGSLYNLQLKNDFEGSAFAYDVVAPAATGYYIYIASSTDPTKNYSSGSFDIVESAGGTLTFNQPVLNDIWVKGISYVVSWEDTFMEPLNVYLKNDDGINPVNITLKTSFNGTSFNYLVPTGVTVPAQDEYYIYIESTTDPAAYNFTSDFFEVALSAGGTLTFNQPELNDIWVKGSAYVISWEDTFMEPLNVYLKNDDAIDPVNITLKTSFNGTTFDYLVPTGATVPAQDEYYIYIESSTNPSTYNFVSDYFEVVLTAGGTITMLSPEGGETWVRGAAYFISWNDDLAEPVDVWLKNDDLGYSLQIKNDFLGTTFDYTLPGTLVPDDAYYVRVESSLDPTTYYKESGDFTVISSVPGTIDIQQPNGGEFLTTGTQYLISWIDDIAENVDIKIYQYSDNAGNGQTGRYEFLNVPGSTMIWNILPTYTGSYFKVRIKSSDPLSTTPEEWSDGYFSISAPVAASVYPNPARDFVSINFDENVSGSFDAVLYDRFNNHMMSFTLDATTKSHRISTAQLPEGVYFLRMTSGTNTIAQKIIVQH